MTPNQARTLSKKSVFIGVSKKIHGKSYFANKNFRKGDIVMLGFGRVIDHQTLHISVQIGIKKHYLPETWNGRYWNHSCNPNTHIRTRSDGFPNLIASKAIKFGEEITYSYWMSELYWTKNAHESKINSRCRCSSANCKGSIFSFSQLPRNDQKEMISRGHCSKYLEEYFEKNKSYQIREKNLMSYPSLKTSNISTRLRYNKKPVGVR
jgi:hypothetical protein